MAEQDDARLVTFEGYGFETFPVRYKLYKPSGRQQMNRRGRWQRMNEYGGWGNCPAPHRVSEAPPDPEKLEDNLAAARARIAELEVRGAALLKVLRDGPEDAAGPAIDGFVAALTKDTRHDQ